MKKILKTLLMILVKFVQNAAALIVYEIIWLGWLNIKYIIMDAVNGNFIYKSKMKEA